jgi:hypothetical protein
MKRIAIVVVTAVICFCQVRYSAADVTIVRPVNLTKKSGCPALDGFNFLVPRPPTKLPPPDEKSAIFNELKNGDTNFSNWTFQKGGKLNGTLTIQDYHSKFIENHFSGGEIRLRYKKGAGDPANIQFVQMVNSTFNKTANPELTGNYPVIDPFPEDEPNKVHPDPAKYRPFYYNEEEWADHTGTGKPGADFDIDFWDFSKRRHPPSSEATWSGDLYITSWDGQTPGTVTFHDGINWGWYGTCNIPISIDNCAPWHDTFKTIVTPSPPGADKVILSFNGAKGTIGIDSVLVDQGGDVNVWDGNIIKIEWSRKLEPNTPLTVQFNAGYQNVTFANGAWYSDGNLVGGVDPCSTTLTKTGPGIDIYNLRLTDGQDSNGASWSDRGTGYDLGHWYRYPNYGRRNVWFYDGPYDVNGHKKINASMSIRCLDANNPASANITLGYSTGAWSSLGYSYPPLPGNVSTPSLENAYIYCDVNHPLFQGPVTGQIQIESSIVASSYHPEWLCVCITGQNVEIEYGFTNYDEPYAPPLGGADFDGSGCVNEHDLRLVNHQWLKGNQYESKYESDLNGDGIVNLRDFAEFAQKWRQNN